MAGQRLKLGAIADDFTGATDLALTLSRGGMRVRQLVGVPASGAFEDDADAVVVSLKSRTIPAADAVAQSLAAAEALLAAGALQLFFKYCSTFDSTDAGNIGPVTEALLARLGEARTIACPAFPTNGRSVYQGHLFVGAQLLSDSPMKDHPLTPMRDASLVRVLGRQTRLPVSLVALPTVRAGVEALRAALGATEGIAIVDAIDDEDLRTIGKAVSNFRLVTGGSGVALGLPANFGFRPGASPVATAAPEGRAVVLAGSCSTATRRQVAVALAAGHAGLRLDPLRIADGTQTVEAGLAFARDSASIPVIYASAAPDAVEASQRALGRERAGAVVEDYLARLARRLVEAGFSRLIVAGGETSGAVVEGLGISALEVGPEIDPGVPWMRAKVDGRALALALKSGNFGSEDMFVKAWSVLV
jgi:uncharacterized protein YgbK (DUF1537 family)